jgi:hypothetical protein
MLAPLKQTFLVPSTTKSAVIVGLDGAISVSGGMVQAWVGHFVTPLKRNTKSTNHLLTNTITMVVEPLAPPAAWI